MPTRAATGPCSAARFATRLGRGAAAVLAAAITCPTSSAAAAPTALPDEIGNAYAQDVRPLVQRYCVSCHSAEKHKGSLDLERFATLAHVRKDLKVWQSAVELLEAGEMPPKEKPQPTAAERRLLVDWVRRLTDAEARARAGDPGFVPLRRLSNAEYDYTVRDLTGVDLRPAKEFPADGAAGEGFANAAEALADVSPTLLNKYLLAAKDVAAHAVLLPDGFRFAAGKTRRDWSDEVVGELRSFYGRYTKDGKLPLQPYLAATIRHREALRAGGETPEAAASKEGLNPQYLRLLWQALTDDAPSFPMDAVRVRWKAATEADAAALAADVAGWQAKVWRTVPIGSYRFGDSPRQVADDKLVAGSQTLRLAATPAPGAADTAFYLSARSALPGDQKAGGVVWGRPRLERAGEPPLLLADYRKFGPAYEVDYPAAFADSAKYLSAVIAAAAVDDKPIPEVARDAGLDAARLQRWVDLLAIEAAGKRAAAADAVGRAVVPAVLTPLTEKAEHPGVAAVKGWRAKGSDLPVALANASDVEEHIPGTARPHAVVVHPTPAEFVATVWTSPTSGTVKVEGRIAHAHGACGNGVAWWLERRRGDRADVLAEGTINVGKAAQLPTKAVRVSAGDRLILAVDARAGDHGCDLTEIALTIAESPDGTAGREPRVWDLSRDVSANLANANPHPDRFGNKDVWSFVKGPTRPVAGGGPAGEAIAPNSVLARWRAAAVDPAQRAKAEKLAEQVQALLSGARPAADKGPDRALYDRLVTVDSPIWHGLDLRGLKRQRPDGGGSSYGLATGRFGGMAPGGGAVDKQNVAAAVDSVIEIRLPAALARGREFVVDAMLASADPKGAARVELATSPPPAGQAVICVASAPVVATPGGAAQRELTAGLDAFRRTFPLYLCFPEVIPTDEVVCLKMYHREDEPLKRLFLGDADRRKLDTLWAEHRFVTQQPLAEDRYLPQFIGFVTQDQPKELLNYFEGQRPTFRKRADDFVADWEAAGPRQLDALAAFAAKAFRRPLADRESTALRGLYRSLRDKGASHEDAFRDTLARVLVSPSFLFRVEKAPEGKEPGTVSDWELATRLSYFLWASVPDDELRAAAAAGKLRDPDELARQARRMVKDDRVRALGVEFGTQWVHVRGFDQLKEKSETLFPTFDDKLRSAIYEESVLFFQDLFQQDRPVARLLDADYTYLNETLAGHYGIPGVAGPQWRRVEGVRKFGRGGLLGLASVQAKQAGAGRTSPVLRGNWVLETLLGEKLPRPPADVPKLPEEEGAGGLTTRQMVERHTSVESCRVCHQRIDPIGFAFERYDAIGRLRDKESTGQSVDSRGTLKDGTALDGIDGLRDYLLAKKKDVVVRLFCRRLLGYALGRAVDVSDQLLLDDLVAAVGKDEGRLSAVVEGIVRSQQFRFVRGSAFGESE